MSVRAKLPSPADWGGSERLYTLAEAAEVLGISQATLKKRVHGWTIKAVAWSEETSYCFTQSSLDKALEHASQRHARHRTYRGCFPSAEMLTPPRMRVSTIDWSRPYEGKESS